MKMFLVSRECNLEIRNILKLEYLREESMNFFFGINTVLPDEDAMGRVRENLVEVLNTIILDNVLRFISNNNLDRFLEGMKNNNLELMLETGYSHIRLLIGNYADVLEELEQRDYVVRMVELYLQDVFSRNRENFNAAIFILLNELIPSFGYLGKRIIRSGFLKVDTPVVFVNSEGL